MYEKQATIWARPPGGSWTAVGAEDGARMRAEDLTITATENGPDQASWTVRRRAGVPWRDLTPLGDVTIDVGAVRVFSGFQWEAPVREGIDEQIGVVAKGWHHHWDDDPVRRWWVVPGLGGLRDARSRTVSLSVAAAHYATEASVATDAGGRITLNLGGSVTTGGRVGVMIDFGPDSAMWPAYVAVDYTCSANSAVLEAYVRAVAIENEAVATGPDISDVASGTFNALGGSGTMQGAPATRRRYLYIFTYSNGFTGTIGSTFWFRIDGLRVFRENNSDYHTSGASALKASTAVKDLRALLTRLPQASDARIETTSFNIAELGSWTERRTIRQLLEAVNAYHDWIVQVDADGYLVFRARPSTPAVLLGDWGGAVMDNAAGGAGENLANRVLVSYVDAAGVTQEEVRTDTSTRNPVNLIGGGFQRTRVMQASTALTQAAAQQVGDIDLAQRKLMPLKGGASVTAYGGARTPGGQGMHPAHLLRYTGQLVRLMDKANPNTGGLGRDAVLRAVTYSHATQTAQLQLDDTRNSLPTLLSRVAAIAAGRGVR